MNVQANSTNYFTQGEYHNHIQAWEQQGDINGIYRAVQDLAGYRHPDLMELCPELYRLPLASAAWLYNVNPQGHRELLLGSAGAVHSNGLWTRLATLARVALNCQDFWLLGRLAHRIEVAIQVHRVTPQDRRGYELHDLARLSERHFPASNTAKPADVTGTSVLAAYLSLFDLQRRRFTLEQNLDAALGYLACLPPSFLVPPDLALPSTPAASEAASNWQLLRKFWTEHALYLPHFPEKLALLQAAPNRHVAQLARRVARLRPPPLDPPATYNSRAAATPAEQEVSATRERESLFRGMAVEIPQLPPERISPRSSKRVAAGEWMSRVWNWFRPLFGTSRR